MKFLNTAAVAALVVAAVPSFAAISLDKGNSEMTLTVWSVGAQASYLQDLGITLDAFKAGPASFNGFSAAVTSELTSHVNLSSAADLQWMVAAYQLNGDLTTGTLQLQTTVNAATAAPSVTGARIQDGTATWFDYIATNNFRTSQNSVANGSSYSTPGSSAYFLSDGGPTGNNNNNLSFSQGNAQNIAANFWYFTPSDPDFGDVDATGIKYAGQWKFDGAAVSYASPSPVPEPQTFALMLAGLAGLAQLVRRRGQR
jgi:hypothetical protein